MIRNYVAGDWVEPKATEVLPVHNPATAEILDRVPLSAPADVAAAACAAGEAFAEWRRVPVTDRIQFLYRLKAKLEERFEELARTITLECGKTLGEARKELRRAIENVEVACGMPALMQGYVSEEIAHGIDELMIRQPLGVCAIVCPFNFPGMIPFWFLPYAVACGNTVLVKPSERVPLTMQKIFEILAGLGLPAGVVNLVNGGRETVDALLDHPAVRAVSFVGSSAAARHVYARAAANGKRAQCQGGAKNIVVVAPDAPVESTTAVLAESAFGCAGQRCLAASIALLVGEARDTFRESIRHAAATRVTGNGTEDVEMGPVISAASKARIEGLIAKGIGEGARASVDGRGARIPGCENGYFLKPTLLEDLNMSGEVARTEIFGPVLGLRAVDDLDEAIAAINNAAYGNMACVFTESGEVARRFRSEADAGNIGVNVGVAAPMAFFPFSGAKGSFFGDLHGQGRDAVEFFTRKKVVVERWPKHLSRTF